MTHFGMVRSLVLKLKDLMYTDTGRDIAIKRHAFLVTFLTALEREMDGSFP